MDLDALVRRVIDDNQYMTVATADADGRPWASPVYYDADNYRDFYWMSSPEVTHSRNLAVRPEIGIVVFDSHASAETAETSATYMTATAQQVPDDELEHALTVYTDVAMSEVVPPAAYRLYRATATAYFVFCPRQAGERCREHGIAADHRTQVQLFSSAK